MDSSVSRLQANSVYFLFVKVAPTQQYPAKPGKKDAMSTKNLVKSAMVKRGSSDWKRHQRRSTRRHVRVACRRALFDPESEDAVDLYQGRSCGRAHRNRCPNQTLIWRLMCTFEDRPVADFERALMRRVGSGYVAQQMRASAREVYEPDGYIWSPYGSDDSFHVDEHGFLYRRVRVPQESLTAEQTEARVQLYARWKAVARREVTRYDYGMWYTFVHCPSIPDVVRDETGALFWTFWGESWIPFSRHERDCWSLLPETIQLEILSE